MIHELRTYTLVPGKQGEYLKLSGDVGRKARGDKYGKLEGHWFTEFGTNAIGRRDRLAIADPCVERDALAGRRSSA